MHECTATITNMAIKLTKEIENNKVGLGAIIKNIIKDITFEEMLIIRLKSVAFFMSIY